MVTRKIGFYVFNDDKGNRFVFPGVCKVDHESVDWAYRMTLTTALLLKEEPDLLYVDEVDGVINMPHVPADATHHNFLHGGSTVWIIGGPIFDEAMAGP